MNTRFWSKVRMHAGGCWEWTAGAFLKGYGKFRDGGKTRQAHRVSYEMAYGTIPPGAGYHKTCVLHRCDNPRCVRPDHLFLGTAADNYADMCAKGRRAHPKGMSNPMVKFSDETVERLRQMKTQGWRQCRIAAELGMSQAQVSRILTGKRR